jgi:hypothetical protein
MNNKRYNQIIDEAYENYADSHWTPPENPNSKLLAPQLWSLIPMQHNKESFIHEIKTNPKFSEKWGLKIEEIKLTWEEQVQWVMKNTDVEWENLYIVEEIAKDTTPKRLLTVTYKDEKIESYEN